MLARLFFSTPPPAPDLDTATPWTNLIIHKISDLNLTAVTTLFKLASILLALAFTAAHARPWQSADGTRTLEGEFVKREGTAVTIRLADGKITTFEITKLHTDDKKWLDLNHPPSANGNAPDAKAVFDTLKFGDTHDQVLTKLKASKFVVNTIPENLIGRTGLNGIFRLKQKVGGLEASLFFDWTETETLNEIQVRTATLSATDYDAKLGPCWQEFAELLTTLHGQPIQAAPKIDPKSVAEGTMLSSHVWRLNSGGSALLGIGCEKAKYQVVVRFTREKIGSTLKKAPTGPAGPKFDF